MERKSGAVATKRLKWLKVQYLHPTPRVTLQISAWQSCNWEKNKHQMKTTKTSVTWEKYCNHDRVNNWKPMNLNIAHREISVPARRPNDITWLNKTVNCSTHFNLSTKRQHNQGRKANIFEVFTQINTERQNFPWHVLLFFAWITKNWQFFLLKSCSCNDCLRAVVPWRKKCQKSE